MAKLYPPQLEGSLPAFCKDYDDDGNLIGCTINIPFGINRAVNIKTISNIALRLRTVSTNTYLISDCFSTNYDAELCVASFKFNYDASDEDTDVTALTLNEGQYYRAQLAFVDSSTGEIGYYSTVGIIKCVAKPKVYLDKYSIGEINAFDDRFLGVYEQNTRFGDSTEKAYSYQFDLYDESDKLILTSEEQIHDVTQDTKSDISYDTWQIFYDLPIGEIYKLVYTVTTLNGLTISTDKYRIMKAISVDPEYNIKIHAEANYDEGYIDISLTGETVEKSNNYIYQLVSINADYDESFVYYIKDSNNSYIEYFPETYTEWVGNRNNQKVYIQEKSTVTGEVVCTGNFKISRATSLDNYFEWNQITEFTMSSDYPSSYHFYDYTVEQGIQYKYAIQQYNTHGIYSNKVYQTDKYGKENTTIADFEDMFLSDGVRQLKVRFNPKVTSFKNTIPEQKIETIGSKYPFIFRNGQVCYKEFPIGGLISFQMDNALLFLNQEELKQAGILDYNYVRIQSGIDNYRHVDSFEQKKTQTISVPIYSQNGIIIGHKLIVTERRVQTEKDKSSLNNNVNSGLITGMPTTDDPTVIRLDRNLTSENMMGERYFKLKVLDWLTDGKVKLFRSPAEGNYLVRLLNVSLSPQDPLGRMLHQFTCTAYEVEELTYTNLIHFGIISPETATHYESQWASVDINNIINGHIGDEDEFIKVSPDGALINNITIQDFAPGDQIKLVYDSGPNGIFSIGVTGSLELNNDDRTIIEVWVKPNPDTKPYDDFSRTFYYETTNIQLTKFDAITDISTYTDVAEQFIGPMPNLLAPYILRDNVYGEMNEDGVVLYPLDELTAFHNVYSDLKAHQRFTYMLNKNTEKFTGLKLDILHVHKKEVIPVYCYFNEDDILYLSHHNWQVDALFGVTPFNIPYVNSTNIKNFVDNQQGTINYVDNVVTIDENGRYILENGVNIEDITTVFDEYGVIYNLYDLLEPFYYNTITETWTPLRELCYTKLVNGSPLETNNSYYNKNGKTYEHVDVEAYINSTTTTAQETLRRARVQLEQLEANEESSIEQIEAATAAVTQATTLLSEARAAAWQDLQNNLDLYTYQPIAPGYYDLYRKEWMDGNEMYDPTFSINDLDTFPERDEIGYIIDTPEFVGDNNISLRETEDMTLYNLGEVEHIRLGNGVVAEITMQIRVVDYEIEQTDPETKRTKDEYLATKALLNKLIDNAMLHTAEITNAEKRATELIEKINKIKDQIGVYGESSTATTGVMAIAEKRLIAQKKQLWYTLEEQLEDILSILKEQQVYLNIDSNNENLVQALNEYIYDDDLAALQDFNELTLSDNNILYLSENPSSNINVLIDTFEQVYNIIDDAYIFYDAQFKAIMAAQQEIIDKCNTQLESFAVQRGTIVGGYLSDYDEENPPPENTLVYTQYKLAQINDQLNNAYNRVVEIKGDLVTKLLQEILKNESIDLTNFTDDYIVNNADELVELLDSYLITRQNDLDNLTNRFYQKATKLIFQLYDDLTTDILRNPLLENEDFLSDDYNLELENVEDLFENKLLNISRTMVGNLKINPNSINEDEEDIELPEETFWNTTGVTKLVIFLKTLLTTEKAKTAKNQSKKTISALETWIEYLVTNKDSYIYEVPQYYKIKDIEVSDATNIARIQNILREMQSRINEKGIGAIFNPTTYECTNYNTLCETLYSKNGFVYVQNNVSSVIDYSIEIELLEQYQKLWIDLTNLNEDILESSDIVNNNIYSAIYFLEHERNEEIPPLEENEEIAELKTIVEKYLKKLTKLTALGENPISDTGALIKCSTNKKVLQAYDAALAAYETSRQNMFYSEGLHPYTLQLHTILKEYYQEPNNNKDSNGITEFESPAPDYNTTLLTYITKNRALIDTYQAAYNLYAAELNAQISNIKSQKAILEGISKNPGYLERVYQNIYSEYDSTAEQEFINNVNQIRDNYITNTTDIINPGLENVNRTVYDFLDIDNNATSEEKVSALLKLLVDEYNRNSANSVQNYLRQYLHPEEQQSNEPSASETIAQLVESIQNTEAAYKLKLKALNNEKEIYEAEQNKYNNQIEELKVATDAIEGTRAEAQRLYDEAQKQLNYGTQTSHVYESKGLIEQIAANTVHQNNVNLVQQYLNWLNQTQENLLTQIGQIFADVTNGEKYAELMLEYINAYEVEAFQFLHPYDALEIDLHEGFYGNDGIDWLYFKPHEYWLSSYEHILTLKESSLDPIEKDNLMNSNDETRIGEYEALKSHLQNALLSIPPEENYPKTIKLAVLCKNQSNNIAYRLVKINDETDKFYPLVYTLNDITCENPINMRETGETFLTNTIDYEVYDCEFRYILPDDNLVFAKDPRASQYYTYESDYNNLIPAFTEPGNHMSEERFQEVAAEAYRNNKPIKWLTEFPPVSIEVPMNYNLYNTIAYANTSDIIISPREAVENIMDTMFAPSNQFMIYPNYYTYFNNMLGLIIHDIRNGEEFGSWMGLKELDESLWTAIAAYFTIWAYFDLTDRHSEEEDSILTEYQELFEKLQDAKKQLEYYRNIQIECEVVLANYEAQENTSSLAEKQQLIMLLESAKEEVDYYTDLVERYTIALDNITTANSEFKLFMLYLQIIPDTYQNAIKIINNYNIQYSLYEQKVNHYLKLLFNNQPYGQYINKTVLQNNELLHIHNNNTDMYNFGLAYAIDAYKNNYQVETPIEFGEITDAVNIIDGILNENYDFVFPIEVTEEYDPNSGKTYFYKEDGKYVQYRYSDANQWEEDKNNLNLYYTYYPRLIQFADNIEYRMINKETENYDITLQYYIYQNGEYIPIEITPEIWDSNQTLYIIKGNGGLNAFLRNLKNGSPYIQAIKDNYNGTLDLYFTLLAQSLGDTTALNNLKSLLAAYELELHDLEEILKYKDTDSIDTAKLIDDIYEKLAWYLVTLTNAYINLVERSYGVV